MKLTSGEKRMLNQIQIGAQRLRLNPDFAKLARKIRPLTVRELVLSAYVAGYPF